jgi:arylsulfatase A-like enzyme
MSGMHGGHAPLRGNSGGVPIRDADVTLAEVLKQAGYATGGYGKWGLGDAETTGSPYRQGFDEFFGYYDQVHAHSYYPDYLWLNDRKIALPGNQARRSDGLTGDKRGTYSADAVMQRARSFIRRNKDRPFFCYIPTTVPHSEMLVPEDSLRQYRGRFPEIPYVSKHYASQRTPRAAFAAMVTRLDAEVGKILALLKELDLDEKTIVFFTSDNGGQKSGGPDGPFFRANAPLRGYKGDLFEGGIRVPFIVRWPGHVAPGTTSDHISAFYDVLPTLAELAGASEFVPEDIDGISMVPTLLGQDGQTVHEFLYWERASYDANTGKIRPKTLAQAVRMGRWKAVRPAQGRLMELFDLQEDVAESADVAAQNRDVVVKIEQIMQREHQDPPPQLEPDSSSNHGWRFR